MMNGFGGTLAWGLPLGVTLISQLENSTVFEIQSRCDSSRIASRLLILCDIAKRSMMSKSSFVAKSWPFPLSRLIVNDPKCSSVRLGFLATYCFCPEYLPPGNHNGIKVEACGRRMALILSTIDMLSSVTRSDRGTLSSFPYRLFFTLFYR